MTQKNDTSLAELAAHIEKLGVHTCDDFAGVLIAGMKDTKENLEKGLVSDDMRELKEAKAQVKQDMLTMTRICKVVMIKWPDSDDVTPKLREAVDGVHRITLAVRIADSVIAALKERSEES